LSISSIKEQNTLSNNDIRQVTGDET